MSKKLKRVTPSITRVRKAIEMLETIGLTVTPGSYIWQQEQWTKWSERAKARTKAIEDAGRARKDPMPVVNAPEHEWRRHH